MNELEQIARQFRVLKEAEQGIEPAYRMGAAVVINVPNEECKTWIEEHIREYYPGLAYSIVIKDTDMGFKQLFDYGQLVITPAVADLAENGLNVLELLKRHLSGDWGDLGNEDKEENWFSLKNGYRIFSHYKTKHGNVYVITEHDRSVTTVLTPEEY